MSVIFSAEGFRALRLAWATLGLGAAVGAMLAWGAYVYSESEKQSLANSRKLLSQAESRLALARRERDDLASSAETYRQLSARGALRPEDRLELVERLATLKAAHKIAALEYEVDPQRKVTVAGLPAEAVELSASHVRLKLQALHEGDALAFLRDVSRPSSGFLPAADCNLRAAEGRAGDGRVEATCNFEWISIRDKRGGRAS